MFTYSRIRCRVVLALVVVLACVASGAQNTDSDWKTVGPASEQLGLASLAEWGSLTLFNFKNLTDKPITAFAVSFPSERPEDVTDHYVDCFETESPCVPVGGSYPVKIPTTLVDHMGSRVIRVWAVIFEDGTHRGSQDHVQAVEGTRLGIALETERTKKILDRLGHQSDPANVDPDEFAREVGELPNSSDDALKSVRDQSLPGNCSIINIRDKHARHAFAAGVSSAREHALREARELREPPAPMGANLPRPTRGTYFNELVKQYSNRSSKHRSYCEKIGGGGK